LAAVLGGAQSLHTNGYDEALSLPSEEAAQIALRTQQIIAFESGVADTADPLGGSYFVESLTDAMVSESNKLINQIDEMGGSVRAIEEGFIQEQISRSAYIYQQEIENKNKIIVGVNSFETSNEIEPQSNLVDDQIQEIQIEKIKQLKKTRNNELVSSCLAEIVDAAKGNANIMPLVIKAVESNCTLGEIAGCLRNVFGEYKS
jgi:methylmalonyl-CoA mutase N-terminal domain/subunit